MNEEPQEEPRFGPLAWFALYSMPPPDFPAELPDEMVRILAGMLLTIRDAGESLERGRRTGSLVDYYMSLSLLKLQVKRLEEFAP